MLVHVWGLTLQGPPPGLVFSLDDLVALLISPFLIVGVVMAVADGPLGLAEYKAGAAAGAVLLGLALLAPPELNVAVAYALWTELGWRIGFQVGSPVSLYWGLVAALMLLGAHEERNEQLAESGE